MFGNNKLDFSFISEVKQKNAEARKNVNVFDSAAGDAAKVVMNLDDKAFNSELLQLRRDALFATFQLSDDILSDDLDEDEVPSDRLDVYVQAGVEDDDDEDNDQLNQQIIQIKASNMADAMSSLGVDDETITKAFGTDVDEADEAIESLAETVEANMPTGDDLQAFIMAFLYGEDDLDMDAGQIEGYDSAQLGKNKVRKLKSGQTLVYTGVKAVRNGKITVVNKRVGNTGVKIKLSAKQKQALRKAAMKAVKPNAIKKRIKSLAVGHRAGIYKKGW